jgi:hypothetical protein
VIGRFTAKTPSRIIELLTTDQPTPRRQSVGGFEAVAHKIQQ